MAFSLNLAEEGIKKIVKMVWSDITPEYLKKLYKILPGRMTAVIHPKGAHTKYGFQIYMHLFHVDKRAYFQRRKIFFLC